MAFSLNPRFWAGLSPQGLGQVKPHHLLETLQVSWQNRDQLGYAWRILNQGVCDGCALGTTGMKDFTLEGLHLCTVRLQLLRLNTMPALDPHLLEDIGPLKHKSSKELRELGRLSVPALRFRGEKGFKTISWDFALDLVARRIRGMDRKRLAFFLTSRGILNENYYVAQKVARFLGTNHVDNAARICHSPSSVALKEGIGESASTCSYRDWIGTDLLILIGSNVANNQPVTTKYMYNAKLAGTKIIVINPYREPGLERYWVPSVPESAMFGTTLMDEFFQVHTGGDLAFLNGVLKALIEQNAVDHAFITSRTEGFAELQAHLSATPWEELEKGAGSSQAEMQRLAKMLAKARSAVFVWSMGITQHSHGVENVRAIVNLALARGFVGREYCGLMPIRGHSGVQGGGEMGCVPNHLPGNVALTPENAEKLAKRWGFDLPTWPGLMAGDMLDAARKRELELLWCVGGNFLETLPDPAGVEAALLNLPIRVHQDICLSSQMLVDSGEYTLLLPATTRYEMPGGGTETTTERQVIFSPEIAGPRIALARTEWQVLVDLAQRVQPEKAAEIAFADSAAIRREIALTCPDYKGIENINKQGDALQWGGRLLCETRFRTASGKAAFAVLTPPDTSVPEGFYRLSTRRGKQFNSMVQKPRDPLTGALRLDVLMASSDLAQLGLQAGAPLTLVSEHGELQVFARPAQLAPGNLQVHWPEGNVLLPPDRRSGPAGVPDYNVLVEIRH
jgi:molybdopterin-dependent oxidoreductase alpha subunit